MLLICTDELDASTAVPADPDVPDPVDEKEIIQKDFDEIVKSGALPVEKRIEFITFVVFDSLQNRVSVTYIPGNTMVGFRGTYVDINTMLYIVENKLYNTDVTFFTDYVTSLTGYDVDMYGLIDIDEYVKFATEHPGLTIDLPENVTVNDRSGRPVSYKAGQVAATAITLRNLITYDSYASRSIKAEILESYSLSVLREITTLPYFSEKTGFFEKCVSSLYDTNADHDGFVQKKSLFFSYGILAHAKINLIGTYKTENGVTLFYPDAAGSISAFK